MDDTELLPTLDALGNVLQQGGTVQVSVAPQPTASPEPLPTPSAPVQAPPAPAPQPTPVASPAPPQPPPSPSVAPAPRLPLSPEAVGVAQQVMAAASSAGLPPEVVGAIVWQESRFNPSTRPVSNGRLLSSATGLFQMLDGDRAEYGVPSGAGIPMQIDAGLKKTRANFDAAKAALGREPTAAELYVVHYQGIGAGPAILRANPGAGFRDTLNAWGRANGKGNWGDTVFAANPWFEKDGLQTNGDFIRWAGAKIDPKVSMLKGEIPAAGANGENLSFTRRIPPFETSPSIAPAGSYSAAVELQRLDQRVAETGLAETFGSAIRQTPTYALIEAGAAPGFAPDPEYRPTEQELNIRRAGLPERYWDGLLGASAAHSDWLERRARENFQAEQQLSEAGWTGIGAEIITSVLDPVSIGVGFVTGGLGAGAAKFAQIGRMGQRLANAAGWGLGNVAVEGVLDSTGRPREAHNYLMAAGLGAALGFGFGPLARSAPDLAADGALAVNSLMTRIERGDPMTSTGLSSPGLSAATNLDALSPLAAASDWSKVSDAFVDHTAIGALRVDVAGQLGTSPNPAARLVGSHLVTDTVGRVDGAGTPSVNPRGADQTKTAIAFRYGADLARTYHPAFDEWAEAQGLNWMARKFDPGARTQFGDLVSGYIRTRDPMLRAQFDEPVRRVGDRMAALLGDLLEDNKNPLRHVNGDGRPMPGLENVERNPHYLPIVYDHGKITAALEAYGERTLQRLLTGSLRSGNPTMEADIAERIADGVLKNFRRRAAGLEYKMSRALAGADQQFLKGFLEELGLNTPDAERALASIANPDKSGPGFTKMRLGFDENYVLPDVPKRGELGVSDIRFTDLTVNDPIWLFTHYANQASGWVALGRMTVDDPTTGNRLVNGLRSEQEVEAFLQRVRTEGAERGVDPKRLQLDEENMRFAFDRILGRPHQLADNGLARWARVARNWNFARLMGNLGIAQLMEVGSVVANTGMRALMQHMPAFRRIVEDGDWVLRNRLDRELEAVLGIGTDPLRGTMAMIHNEAVGVVDSVGGRSVLDRAEDFSRRAAHLTNTLSGGRDLTAGMQRWTAKLMAQKFADMAEDAIGRRGFGSADGVDLSRLSRGQMARLRYLGLSDDMIGRVLSQVKEHGHFADGSLFPGKLLQLQLDQWGDVEARSAFESAIFRASRKIIQETDVGAMHRWASSPIYQTLFQFRTFAITAWSNQFLHNVAMKDPQAFVFAASTLMASGLIYAAQTHIQAQFEGDKQAFLERRLNPTALALASFQRSGWSSLIPLAVDSTLAHLTPYDPMFDFRTSGQSSDIIFGNPTFGLFSDVGAAAKGIGRPILDDRDFSQQEARAATRIMALQNWMPIASVYSLMLSDLPNRPPRSSQGWRPQDLLGN